MQTYGLRPEQRWVMFFCIALPRQLEAEPVAWTDADELRDAQNGGSGYLFAIGGDANKFADPRRQLMLYTTAPAPIVPCAWEQWIADAVEYLEGGLEADGELEAEGSIEAKRLLSRRAAMLQGADGNSPDGWVACSERMPDSGTEIFYFCQDDGLRDCGIVSSANFSDKGDAQLYVHAEGYDLRFGVDITHRMPLPAAPQQEVK